MATLEHVAEPPRFVVLVFELVVLRRAERPIVTHGLTQARKECVVVEHLGLPGLVLREELLARSRLLASSATAVGAYLGALWLIDGNLLSVIIAHAIYDFLALIVLVGDDPLGSDRELQG